MNKKKLYRVFPVKESKVRMTGVSVIASNREEAVEIARNWTMTKFPGIRLEKEMKVEFSREVICADN